MLTPSRQQAAWQKLGLGIFIHFGINTFFDAEWSDGTLPATGFNPTALDADQWAQTAAEAGANYIILTAKHHDGFCLWPTSTTDYSVASSPRQVDVVGEFAAAARRHGLAVGLYLSPWDRNAECYDDPPAYDDFYRRQLTELCTNYGELVEIWFDGAGSAGREYDWESIMAVVREHQPNALVFNMGDPDIRWVGNEDGLAHDPVEYVVAATAHDNYGDGETCLGALTYLPPECDVSIRQGWFWSEADQPKSVEHLLAIYYNSIGMGANLLLNLPPDRRGLIPDEDIAVLRQWRAELDDRFGQPLQTTLTGDGAAWRARLLHESLIDHVALREDYSAGQRITGHRVRTRDGQLLAEGLTVGECRLHAFEPISAQELVIEVDGDGALLVAVEAFNTGGRTAPALEYRAPTVEPSVASREDATASV